MKTIHTVLAAAMAAAVGCAHAQSIKTLDPVVVTASKIEEPQGQATVLVEVISRQDIEESGAANISELLDQVSGGLLTRQYGRLGVDAAFDLGYLGGGSAQRTLIMVDGVRMNDIDGSTIRWGQLPLDAIEQVEIRKAGGGVLFGDRALGGVVNIITKRAEDSGSAHVTVGSFGTRAIGLHKSARSGDTQLQVSAQQAEADGYRESVNQKIRSLNLGISQSTEIGLIGMDLRSFEEDTLLPNSITLATFQRNPRAAPGGTTGAKRRGSNVGLSLSSPLTRATQLKARISYDESKSTVGFPVIFPSTRAKARYAGDVSVSKTVSTTRILAGLELFDASVDSRGASPLSVEQRSKALYVSSETPVRTSLLNLGIRQQTMTNTFTPTTAAGAQRSNEDLRSWSIGGLTPLAETTLRYSIQSSFAFPTADQLFFFQNTGARAQVGINLGIRAMKSDEAQIALSRSFEQTKVEAGSRFLKIKDEIGFKSACSGAGIDCNANLFDTQRLIAFARISGSLTSSVSWAVSADRIQSKIESGTNSGKRVPMVPDLVAKGSLSWKRDQSLYRVVANHRGQMVMESNNSNNLFRIPARLTLDAGYSYAWPSQRRDLSLWVRNITDRQYFDFAGTFDEIGSGVAPADGRSVELRVKQDF